MTTVMEYPAGTQFAAGMGVATALPDMDFETFSAAGYVWVPAENLTDLGKWTCLPGAPQDKKGLQVIGAAVYSEHPSTEVISFKYNLKDGRGSIHWRPGVSLHVLQPLFDHIATGGLMEAHNSAFERWIWHNVCTPKYGWPYLPPQQLRCSMGKARAWSLPGKLDLIGTVLRLPIQKDKEGTRLLDKFSKPRNPTKNDPRWRITVDEDPVDGAKLFNYNGTDIEAEAEASARIPDLEGDELQFWLSDQAINMRGVQVDREAIEACAALVGEAHKQYALELRNLTSGVVEQASQVARLTGWLAAHGCIMDNMQEETVEAKLKLMAPHPPDRFNPARRALEIRAFVGSASVKKVYAMRNQITKAGRLHDLFNYHGARTGRPTGEGPQPTNLPRSGPDVYKCGACSHYFGIKLKACPWCGVPVAPEKKKADWTSEAAEDALRVIMSRNLALVQYYFGDAMGAVSGVLRALFIAAPGHDLICSDFSAIEAVVLAMLANEQWRIDVFRTHGKIYELSASKILGIPFEEFKAYKDRTGSNHPARQDVGKVAELALGFKGWIGAWRNFDGPGTDDEVKGHILKWRADSPNIEYFWGGQNPCMFGLEGMAVSAVINPGTLYPVLRKDGTHTGISYVMRGDALYCQLPSGRYLTYHRPRLQATTSWRGTEQALSYEGYNTNPKQGAIGWVRMSTYGGKLTENVVQAVARDIQRHAINNLERCGYPVVLHVYDEDVSEIPEGFGSIEEYERIMNTMPAWAAGWPIKAGGGWRGKRYRKG